jgi:hypothetical protein
MGPGNLSLRLSSPNTRQKIDLTPPIIRVNCTRYVCVFFSVSVPAGIAHVTLTLNFHLMLRWAAGG